MVLRFTGTWLLLVSGAARLASRGRLLAGPAHRVGDPVTRRVGDQITLSDLRPSAPVRKYPPIGAALTSRVSAGAAVQIGTFGVAWIGRWRSWRTVTRAERRGYSGHSLALLRGQPQCRPDGQQR